LDNWHNAPTPIEKNKNKIILTKCSIGKHHKKVSFVNGFLVFFVGGGGGEGKSGV